MRIERTEISDMVKVVAIISGLVDSGAIEELWETIFNFFVCNMFYVFVVGVRMGFKIHNSMIIAEI